MGYIQLNENDRFLIYEFYEQEKNTIISVSICVTGIIVIVSMVLSSLWY